MVEFRCLQMLGMRRFWYNASMKPSEISMPPKSLIGHVRSGVVVLDAQNPLVEGQAVRVEPLGEDQENQLAAELAERIGQLQRTFAEWTAEDGKLSDGEADCLHTALEENGRLNVRTPTLV
jgi:hypothetical protein